MIVYFAAAGISYAGTYFLSKKIIKQRIQSKEQHKNMEITSQLKSKIHDMNSALLEKTGNNLTLNSKYTSLNKDVSDEQIRVDKLKLLEELHAFQLAKTKRLIDKQYVEIDDKELQLSGLRWRG